MTLCPEERFLVMQQFPMPVVPNPDMKELSGLLSADRTRGKWHLYTISGQQILFPDALFEFGSQRVRQLTEKGRDLWRQLFELVGKGVTLKGDFFQAQVPMNAGQAGFMQLQYFITIKSVEANSAFDQAVPRMRKKPVLDPEVVEHDKKQAEKDYAEQIKNETSVERKRRLFNEQLEEYHKDEPLEALMAREGV